MFKILIISEYITIYILRLRNIKNIKIYNFFIPKRILFKSIKILEFQNIDHFRRNIYLLPRGNCSTLYTYIKYFSYTYELVLKYITKYQNFNFQFIFYFKDKIVQIFQNFENFRRNVYLLPREKIKNQIISETFKFSIFFITKRKLSKINVISTFQNCDNVGRSFIYSQKKITEFYQNFRILAYWNFKFQNFEYFRRSFFFIPKRNCTQLSKFQNFRTLKNFLNFRK